MASMIERRAQAAWDEHFVIPEQEYLAAVKQLVADSPLTIAAIARRLHVSRSCFRGYIKQAPSPLLRRAIITAINKINKGPLL